MGQHLYITVNSIFFISGTITFSHSIGKKMKHRYQSFTRIGRQFQSLERQVYADWTSVSFPFCQRSCLIWRIMTNTLTNTMTNTYVVIFLSVSIFGRGYHSRYQNFEFTDTSLCNRCCPTERYIRTVRIPGDLWYEHLFFSFSNCTFGENGSCRH